jgi:FkbM family methyltransferase
MTSNAFASWLPTVNHARGAMAHLWWTWRRRRADGADRRDRPFRYSHPDIGPFVYHPGDYLSRRLFLHNDFEGEELRFAIDRARGGGTILDVGANIGAYTVACARAAGDRGHVIAVEPGRGTFEKLTRTCAWLGLENVTTVQAAAGRINGAVDFVSYRSGRDVQQHLADARPHEACDRLQVESRRLDDVCGPEVGAVTLVKLDIQGHEIGALEGARHILANRRAHLIVEFYLAGLRAAGGSSGELWALLRRTHECVAILCANGSARPPVESSLTSDDPEDFFNTLWVPRGAR